MDLDRSHLELLEALDRYGTLAKAGEQLHLSPSAASRRLAEARRRVGVDLVEANGRSVRLTASGRILAETARDLSQTLAVAQTAARWLAAGHESPVGIGVGFYDEIGWLLPRWADHPYEILRSPTHVSADTLTQARVHIALDVSSESDPRGTDLLRDELALAASRSIASEVGSPATPESVGNHRYLTYQLDPRAGYEFERFFLPAGCYPSTIIVVESLSVSLEMVARGDAVMIQPRRLLEERQHPGVEIIPLDNPVPVRWTAIRSRHDSHAADELFDALVHGD